MKRWNKKILTVMMEHDYGDPSRGVSGEKIWFHDNLAKLTSNIDAFWYDSLLGDLPKLRERTLAKVRETKPDLIFFVPYTDQFDSATLDEMRKIAPTAAWFGDDHWRFESYTKTLAPHITHPITTDPWALPLYDAIGAKPILSEWAAQAKEGALPDPRSVSKFEWDVTFVGSANEVRTWFVRELAKRGIEVACFGGGWPNGRIDAAKMDHIFTHSKISLNLSNSVPQDLSFVMSRPRNFARWMISKKQSEQVKARNFEIPLVGGFQLSRYALGLERHLEIGKEVAVFTSVDECAKQIRYYLSRENERREMAALAAERTRREHTYLHRLEKILGEVWPG
ncbi:MAG: glycosyltransferase [Bdellovibrionota bacterium]